MPDTPAAFFQGVHHFFSRVFPALFCRPASSFQDHIIISELPLTPCTTSQRTCTLPTYDFSVPAAPGQPTWNGFCNHFHLVFYLLCFTVLISSVSCQCPETMLSLSSSQTEQLAALGTKESAWLRWPFFGPENFILKTMMFREVTTVLNERTHLEMVGRSVPDDTSQILGWTKWLGLTALHCAVTV